MDIPVKRKTSVSFCDPGLVGVKVTLVVQVAPVASVPTQEFPEMAYCVPVVNATEEKVMVDPLWLVKTTDLGELAFFTSWFPNARDVGTSSTVAVPVTSSETTSGL